MLEYFGTNIKEFKKYSYKVKNGKIPIDCINIKSIDEFSSLDEQNIFVYKCREKANSHNNRVKHLNKITMYDVLNCLKRFDFTCFYCGGKISSKLWHLDHVHPISKGGLNSNNNIASSCKECNLMKGCATCGQ